MTKELWINLPVKDISVSKAFFTKVGFSFKDGPGVTATSAPMTVGSKGVVVMLFEHSVFKCSTLNELADTDKGTEVLFSFDAESKQEVDEICQRVKAAGGTVFAEPSNVHGWMYGFGFIDPDGHRWNALYMDMG